MNDDLILYYANLLILQYRTKPKAHATIIALIRVLMVFDIIREVENGYDVDTAVGKQLDVLAKYVGAERVATGIDFSRVFFGMVNYSSSPPYTDVAGFLEYTEANPPDAQFLEYNTDQVSSFTLTDEELRILVKLKIAQNNSNHSNYEIDTILYQFFPGQVIFTDNKNMTISYIFDSDIQRIINIAASQGAIPKPAAVGLDINFVPDLENIFSLLDYGAASLPPFSKGLVDYSDSTFGSFLTY